MSTITRTSASRTGVTLSRTSAAAVLAVLADIAR